MAQRRVKQSVVDRAIAAAMDALPQRLSLQEMAAAAGVSTETLHRSFARVSRLAPIQYVQQLCLRHARRDLKKGAPGDTVFAVARRWGFSSSDGAFREGYWAAYDERPIDTLKRARALKPVSPPAATDHVVCRECGRTMRRLRRHLAAVHDLTPDAYRRRWRLPRSYPLVCAELSNEIAARARANNLAGKGNRARKRWKSTRTIKRNEWIDGESMPPRLLVAKAEELVLAALPSRLSERYLAERLGVGRRTLRRSFLDERGATVYVVLRHVRLQEAQRRIQSRPGASPKIIAKQCGFGDYVRFRRDLKAWRDATPASASPSPLVVPDQAPPARNAAAKKGRRRRISAPAVHLAAR